MLGQGIVVPDSALERLSELMGTKVLHAERSWRQCPNFR
jgi:hypothetical protein